MGPRHPWVAANWNISPLSNTAEGDQDSDVLRGLRWDVAIPGWLRTGTYHHFRGLLGGGQAQ
eukprot:4853113-Pyramimonas_sp.AAC.1